MRKGILFMFMILFLLAGSSVNVSATQMDDSDLDIGIEDLEPSYELTIEHGVVTGYEGEPIDVVVPEDVTGIKAYAFENCRSLKSIELPSGLTSIEAYAFSGCSSLTSIELPDGLTNIAVSAFSDCRSLTSVVLPSALRTIEEDAFMGCKRLKGVEFPSGLVSIGDAAFSGCSALTSIEIPAGVTSIGGSAFSGCSNLTSIELPESVTSIGGGAFNCCSSLTSIEIPEGITIIGSSMFYGCSNLSSVRIPASVERIGVNVFHGCENVVIYGKAGSYIETYAKENDISFVADSEPISIEQSKVTLTYTGFIYNGKAKKPGTTVELNGVVLKKGTDYTVAYKNNKNIGTGSVVITGIGNYQGTITETFRIKTRAGKEFTVDGYKYKITSATRATVAFAGITSTSATSVTIPNTVKYGGATFKVTAIADKALRKNKMIRKVTMNSNIRIVGDYAFYQCTKLSYVVMGTGITTIEDHAFRYCTSLKSIVIPSKVTKIDKEAFYGSRNLKVITIKTTALETVKSNALKGIYAKAKIKVPASKLSAYKKLLKGKGQGSGVTIEKRAE